ncbi:conserved Plasmodium protein, unknown function [Plasmodium sp. gorilla clade G3]|nr:conserved Plasmodium protein, unknown function [Plasmodium sp. gorilla clade G3]
MFRSKAHFLMLSNLKYLELQDLLLKRFQVFKNEEIRILKKENMKCILYEWAKFLIKENYNTNITYIPQEVLHNNKVQDILKNDIDCKWLVNKIHISNDKNININSSNNFEELKKKKDALHFDEYPNLFYYEYPQFPYNYYDKKKMSNFYSLIKFPYKDILNISKNIKNISNEEEQKTKNDQTNNNVSNNEENKKNQDIVHMNNNNVNYTDHSYVYAPCEMETSKENYNQTHID